MNTFTKILVVLGALFVNTVMAQQDISGTWQGDLPTGPDSKLTVQFILQQRADGTWSAVLNSTEMGGIKNVSANAVEFDGVNLKLDVSELSGAYAGILKDGAFEGEWSQAGESMPLNLKPYVKPVLSQADMDLLLGEWNGKLEIPSGALTLVFHFEKNAAGELAGFAASPDQGANDLPVTDIELVDGVLQLKIPATQAAIKGKLTGTQFVGEFIQGQALPLTLNKGKYEPQVNALALSSEAMGQLQGEWYGEMDTPAGTMAVVYRFETNAEGEQVAFRDNPDQGIAGIPVSEASLSEGLLSLKTAGPGGGFSGKLSGDEITGEMQSPMGAIPLTLNKGKYAAPSYRLSLSSEAMELLQGKWQGKLATPQATLTLVFRFESQGAGEYYGFVDSPDQRAIGLKMTEANLVDGQLSLTIKFPRAEFKGKLAGNELAGEWIQGPGSLPLTMKKD